MSAWLCLLFHRSQHVPWASRSLWCQRCARWVLMAVVAVALTGCASFPMPKDARGSDGQMLPDLCYQWTFWGLTKALSCHPAPTAKSPTS